MDEKYGRFGSGRGIGGDPLDKALRDMDRENIQNIKRLQLKKLTLVQEREVSKLEKEINQENVETVGISAVEAAQLAQLPDDQRLKAIQAMTMMRSMSGNKNNPMSMMVVQGMLNQKPQTSISELVGALKGLNDMQKRGEGGSKMSEAIALAQMMQTMTANSYQSQLSLMQNQMDQLRPMNTVDYAKNVAEISQAFGFSKGGDNQSFEAMKYKTDIDLTIQKNQQEFERWKIERDENNTFKTTLLELIAPIVDKLSSAGASKLTGIQAGQARQATCPGCQYSPVWVSDDSPAACPQCGQQIVTEGYQRKIATEAPQPQNQPLNQALDQTQDKTKLLGPQA